MSDEHDDEPQPLDRREADLVRRDMRDLAAFRETFEPDGYKGVSLYCADCAEEHFYGWDMLEGNLRTLLESGESPVHEPPFDPRPDDYVDWEYARGYLDGLMDSEVLPLTARRDGRCPFCDADIGELTAAPFCPACGTALGLVRLADELVNQGMATDDVQALLRDAGLPIPAAPTTGPRSDHRQGRRR